MGNAVNVFRELGDAVAAAWRSAGHDEEAFGEIATTALRERELHRSIDIGALAELASAPGLPAEQLPATFGDPPLVVYAGHKFHIEVLFWLDSTTAIHQHAFEGAWGVLAGSSIHSSFRFERHGRVAGELLLGRVEHVRSELLKVGDVREIRPGPAFLHSLFHLEQPSVSVVVRTFGGREHQPQYSYHRPGLAIDPFFEPQPLITQLALLRTLREIDLDVFWAAAQRMVEGGDLWLCYQVLVHASGVADEPEYDGLIAAARARHGQRLDYLLAALEERVRRLNITARRARISEPDHRYLLGLLLSVPDRAGIYRLVAERHPGADPAGLVWRWLRELSERDQIGLRFDAVSLQLLAGALEGATYAQACARLNGNRPSDATTASIWNQIRRASLLQPLVADLSPAAVEA